MPIVIYGVRPTHPPLDTFRVALTMCECMIEPGPGRKTGARCRARKHGGHSPECRYDSETLKHFPKQVRPK